MQINNFILKYTNENRTTSKIRNVTNKYSRYTLYIVVYLRRNYHYVIFYDDIYFCKGLMHQLTEMTFCVIITCAEGGEIIEKYTINRTF